MLRRSLILGIVFLFLCLVGVRADAPGWIKIYNIDNDTASESTTYISISTLVPNQSRILSWTVMPTRSNAYSPLVSVWDEASGTAHSLSNLIGESEAPANTSQDKIFTYPRNISTQVKVILGPYSSVNIEYLK